MRITRHRGIEASRHQESSGHSPSLDASMPHASMPHASMPSTSVSDYFQVLSTAGDTHLGGDDFDQALIGLFTAEIRERFGDVSFPPATRQALSQFAELAKIRLSDQVRVAVRIALDEARTYERTVTRDEFEALVAPLVERTLAACARALRDAKRQMDGDPVSAVVLVGGATRTPLVRRKVREFFGLEPYMALAPDLVVALGAAVQAR
ncbi:MAG: Hsp70 family protein, partial [Phycisphaerales bacterium]|nr:Hsp70 family protein [Phycisphaerales bacterium]